MSSNKPSLLSNAILEEEENRSETIKQGSVSDMHGQSKPATSSVSETSAKFQQIEIQTPLLTNQGTKIVETKPALVEE